jgi:endonuclease III
VVLEKTRTQIKLSREQELKIKDVLIRAWQTNDREDNKGALEIVETYEKVAKLSEAERNKARGPLHDVILKSIRAEPDDELARLLLSAYESSHSTNPGVTAPSTGSNSSTENKVRVGTDGFTGIYRMLRPRA